MIGASRMHQRERIDRPEPVEGARLLPSKDAFLQARDRDVLFTEPAHRKQVFPMLGGPGVVLHDAKEEASVIIA